MDNATRSERTQAAVLQAALTIIARDGPGRLTLDAIVRESGISKGGVMHQFRNKEAVITALLEHQIAHFEHLADHYRQSLSPDHPAPHLAAQITTMRAALDEMMTATNPVCLAVFGALAEDPQLLSSVCSSNTGKMAAIRDEAEDPDRALLTWLAAQGLMITSMLGTCPLPPAERQRLFDRLLAESGSPPPQSSVKPRLCAE